MFARTAKVTDMTRTTLTRGGAQCIHVVRDAMELEHLKKD